MEKENFGARIRELIDTLHITQQEFAEKIGAKQGNISSYISGKKKPSPVLIKSILVTYGVREEWFYTGEKPIFIESTSYSEKEAHMEKLRNRLIFEIQTINNEPQLLALLAYHETYNKYKEK